MSERNGKRLPKTVAGLLRQRSRWCQGALARSEDGTAVDPLSDLAVCWCLAGAIRLVYQGDPVGHNAAYTLVRRQIGQHMVTEFNDVAPHWQVVQVAELSGI